MKRNDIKNLHSMTVADLQKKLAEVAVQVAKVRLEKKVGRVANVKQLSTLSDDIARIKTVIRQKEMEANV